MSGVDKNTGIWNLSIAKKRHRCDLSLVEAMKDLYKPKTFADIGCGNGQYCKYFKDFGWSVVDGYEGTKDIISLGIYNNIIQTDLTKIMDIEKVYDLVMCIEVGEHIPMQYEDIFLENVCKLIGNHLIISWAPVGQRSCSGHVNPRSTSYVINKMQERFLKYDESTTSILRNRSSFSWFKNNLMVFEKLKSSV